jgi:hypothetical protein
LLLLFRCCYWHSLYKNALIKIFMKHLFVCC